MPAIVVLGAQWGDEGKGKATDLLATTDYGGPVPALVARGNRAGTQFHVEKSQQVGLRILANFLRWEPERSGQFLRDRQLERNGEPGPNGAP